jgi:hypothetical protein
MSHVGNRVVVAEIGHDHFFVSESSHQLMLRLSSNSVIVVRKYPQPQGFSPHTAFKSFKGTTLAPLNTEK